MSKSELKRKRVLVVGMGLSGRSAVQFLISRGSVVYAVDRDHELLQNHREINEFIKMGLKVFSDSEWKHDTELDLIVLSPGVPQTHPIIQNASAEGIPFVGEIELGCQHVENSMIGITGTNGKTSVTMLVTHVLHENGLDTHSLGNVGSPFTKELSKLSAKSLVVLELSSYQLETLSQRVFESGVILNLTPDHLDRYGTMEAYAQAKCKLANNIKPGGFLYVLDKTWQEFRHLFERENIRLFGYSNGCYIHTNLESVFVAGEHEFDLPQFLKGKKSHELENFLAAYAVCREQGIGSSAFLHSFFTFKKPSHRIEFVAEHSGVCFINDSKGTNIDAVIRAVEFIKGSIILIAGGVDKGAPYTSWLKSFENKVKSVCAIGQAAVKMRDQLTPQIPVMIFESLEEAVHQATFQAVEGDTVLLSPGCSSFDMFRDYVHRGEEFRRIVHRLKEIKR
jgi:UDP-N-acetylmuramoylalanine--D-glutamate ligase